MPFVSKNNILVSTINGTGAAIELIYVLTFIIYAPKREKAKFIGLLTLVLTTFGGVALVSLVVLQGKSREIFCGFAAAIFSIIMYGSPLSIMVRQINYSNFIHGIFAVPGREKRSIFLIIWQASSFIIIVLSVCMYNLVLIDCWHSVVIWDMYGFVFHASQSVFYKMRIISSSSFSHLEWEIQPVWRIILYYTKYN